MAAFSFVVKLKVVMFHFYPMHIKGLQGASSKIVVYCATAQQSNLKADRDRAAAEVEEALNTEAQADKIQQMVDEAQQALDGRAATVEESVRATGTFSSLVASRSATGLTDKVQKDQLAAQKQVAENTKAIIKAVKEIKLTARFV